MEITRHFTATTFVVFENKVLLHLHKKLGMILPVGGHIDRDEIPEEAALREVKEESGLEATLYNPQERRINLSNKEECAIELISPMHILLEDINQFHQHIDFIYYAYADTFELSPNQGETNNLKWYSLEDIQKSNDITEDVKKLAIEALELLC